MKPKYTDLKRYPRGYKPSHDTDITKTWAEARRRMEEEKKKREEIVRELPKPRVIGRVG
jgi:hypothetical protein